VRGGIRPSEDPRFSWEKRQLPDREGAYQVSCFGMSKMDQPRKGKKKRGTSGSYVKVSWNLARIEKKGSAPENCRTGKKKPPPPTTKTPHAKWGGGGKNRALGKNIPTVWFGRLENIKEEGTLISPFSLEGHEKRE